MVVTDYTLTNVRTNVLSTLDTNISHIASGDDNTTPVSTDTTLGNETYREAKFDSNVAGDTLSVDLRLDETENNSNNMEEIGGFDAASLGTMYFRTLITLIAKDSTVRTFHRTKIKYVVKNA